MAVNRNGQNPGLMISGDGFMHFELTVYVAPNRRIYRTLNTAPGSVPLGSWMQVAETWDGTLMRSYLNGNLKTSVDVPGGLRIATMSFLLGVGDEDNTQLIP